MNHNEKVIAADVMHENKLSNEFVEKLSKYCDTNIFVDTTCQHATIIITLYAARLTSRSGQLLALAFATTTKINSVRASKCLGRSEL